jgi:hypothetical protein
MEKRDKAEELINSLGTYGQLEEVPAEVSLRYKESLSALVLSTQVSQKKKSWFTGSNQFALAASFTLVFALGAVITLNLGTKPGQSVSVNQSESPITSEESGIKEDQLLYSAGESSLPKESTASIIRTNSTQDYSSIPNGFAATLNVGTIWNSADNLDSETIGCLKSLELDRSTNLIDSGFFQGRAIQAIWTPVSEKSWNIYLVDINCEVLGKDYISDK